MRELGKERINLLNSGKKQCYKCKEIKELSLFYKDASRADGFEDRCKDCKKKYDKERHKKNWTNLEKRKEQKNRNAEQFQKHKEKRNKYHIEYKRKRRAVDPVFRLRENISSNLRMFVKYAKKDLTFNYIGMTKIEFWNYLKETIPEGYSEENFLNGELAIDHIIPQHLYDYSNQDEIRKSYNYRNLRLIPKRENCSKNGRLDKQLVLEYKIEDLLPEGFIL